MAKLWMRLEKLKKYIHVICNALELIAAGLMLVGVVFTIIGILRNFELFSHLLTDTSLFREYMEQVFMLVIGIEFLVMLCRPNSENVMEVLIFLVARHMIVGETTSFEDFVSVVSITILCVVRRYLRINNEKRGEKNEEEYITEKEKSE
ncbi:MAG: hypothetical protein K2P50_02830 [Lachnospiraceae bacterium]|nr:hypothetical protein [Lachnospiraceae bacterium]